MHYKYFTVKFLFSLSQFSSRKNDHNIIHYNIYNTEITRYRNSKGRHDTDLENQHLLRAADSKIY